MKIINRTVVTIFIVLLLSFSLYAQTGETKYSLWFGSHYTGFDQYQLKVAEFDRGVDGFSPEIKFNMLHLNGQNTIGLKGYYYDPKRMNLTLQGQSGQYIKGSFTYKSFYRQYQ